MTSRSIPSPESVARTRYVARFVIRMCAVGLFFLGLSAGAGPLFGTAIYLIEGGPSMGGGSFGSGYVPFEFAQLLDIPWSTRAPLIIENSPPITAILILFGRSLISWALAGLLVLFCARIVRFVAPFPKPGCPVCGYETDLTTPGACPECGVEFGSSGVGATEERGLSGGDDAAA